MLRSLKNFPVTHKRPLQDKRQTGHIPSGARAALCERLVKGQTVSLYLPEIRQTEGICSVSFCRLPGVT